MFKKWCTIKTRLPRPQPAETIASINLFLETLPQFSDSDLTLILDEEAGTYIYPTDELKGATWLATTTEPRWEDDASAIDWAYKTLEGSTMMRFITLLQPMKTLHKGEILEYFAYQHKHEYRATEQVMNTGVSIFLAGALENTLAEIFQAKIRCMLSVLSSLKSASRPLFIWCDSFLEVGSNYPDELPALLASIEEQPTAFVTLSTNGANHFGRLAEKILTLTLPPRTTDAELLNRILPWGSRTRLFGHGVKETKGSQTFFFCYIKPLRQYPPIRVEVPAKIPPDDIDAYIDRVMAHVILNPNIL